MAAESAGGAAAMMEPDVGVAVAPPAPAQSRGPRLVFLDALRIVAFAAVLAGHKYGAAYAEAIADPSMPAWLRAVMVAFQPMIKDGGAGVVVFFLVSGYVIAHVLMRESTGVFLVRRFFRIYPLYVVAVLLHISMVAEFPGWPVFLAQLSLFGDLFHAPLTLGGVEWTLRIEVLFYVYMAILKQGGFIDGARMRWMPAAMFGTVAVLLASPPMPDRWAWYFGYVNLYAPFLLLGTYFFLFERQRARIGSLLVFCAFVLVGYGLLFKHLRPMPNYPRFAYYAFTVFAVFWLLRGSLRIGAFGLAISELTYAVYLFHNWLYNRLFERLVAATTTIPWLRHVLTVVVLLLFCWVATRLVERPAIRLGRIVSDWIRARPPAPAIAGAAD